jgi:hypothetical protein
MSQLVSTESVTICLNAKHSGSIFGSVRQTQTVQYTCEGIVQREGCICGGGCVFCMSVVVVGLSVDVLVSRQEDDRKKDGSVSV